MLDSVSLANHYGQSIRKQPECYLGLQSCSAMTKYHAAGLWLTASLPLFSDARDGRLNRLALSEEPRAFYLLVRSKELFQRVSLNMCKNRLLNRSLAFASRLLLNGFWWRLERERIVDWSGLGHF